MRVMIKSIECDCGYQEDPEVLAIPFSHGDYWECPKCSSSFDIMVHECTESTGYEGQCSNVV